MCVLGCCWGEISQVKFITILKVEDRTGKKGRVEFVIVSASALLDTGKI